MLSIVIVTDENGHCACAVSRDLYLGPVTTKNLETLTPICLFTIQLSGATMMIKGSLLCSVPIVKHFGPKFRSPKMGRKFEVLGGLGGEKF